MICCNAKNIYKSWTKIKPWVSIRHKANQIIKKKKKKEKKKLDNFIKLNAGVPFGVSTFESTGCLMHTAHGAPSKQINVWHYW